MAPIWPFKRKAQQPLPKTPNPVAYVRGGDGHAEQALEDRTHVESSHYQDAMAALATPHLGTEVTSPVAPSVVEDDQPTPAQPTPVQPTPVQPTPVQPTPTQPPLEWFHHTDGYWYQKKADGSFDSTPHVKGAAGELTPYSP